MVSRPSWVSTSHLLGVTARQSGPPGKRSATQGFAWSCPTRYLVDADVVHLNLSRKDSRLRGVAVEIAADGEIYDDEKGLIERRRVLIARLGGAGAPPGRLGFVEMIVNEPTNGAFRPFDRVNMKIRN